MSEIDIPNYIKTLYNFGADIDGDRLTAEKSTIESALKLQELMKKSIQYELTHKSGWDWTNEDMASYLKDLVEESEK